MKFASTKDGKWAFGCSHFSLENDDTEIMSDRVKSRREVQHPSLHRGAQVNRKFPALLSAAKSKSHTGPAEPAVKYCPPQERHSGDHMLACTHCTHSKSLLQVVTGFWCDQSLKADQWRLVHAVSRTISALYSELSQLHFSDGKNEKQRHRAE